MQHDARFIPGLVLSASDLSGRAVFRNEDEQLTVITANRTPLERVFGIDLIYLNHVHENIVMVQYKMLEKGGDDEFEDYDWIYRPDQQLKSEIERMKCFVAGYGREAYEYRLNEGLFYLKFVKRGASISSGGIVLPLEHYELLVESDHHRGPRSAVRISFEELGGAYLREDAFTSLIRSGYIGSCSADTEHLWTIVEALLRSGRSVVAAIQSVVP